MTRGITNLAAGLISGTLCACGGAWKDAPYEGFKRLTFVRSIWVGILAGAVTVAFTDKFLLAAMAAGYLERCAVEGYKILRGQAPSKFFTGSRGHIEAKG